MEGNFDYYALELARSLISLKDYKNDGVLSYCDISDLELLSDLSQKAISKVIEASENKNSKAIQQICSYEHESLVERAAMDLYTWREVFSKCHYYLTQLNAQLVHHIEIISLIPGGVSGHYSPNNSRYVWPKESSPHIIKDDAEEKYFSIREKFCTENKDIDMHLDKLINTFYQYFEYGHPLMNDTDIVSYSFSLLSAVSSGAEKRFYNFVKNTGLLISMFVVLDRISQLKKELSVYSVERQYYLVDHPKIPAASWLHEPRKSNIEDIQKLLDNDKLESDIKIFNYIIKKHIDYLSTVQYVDTSI